MEIYNEQDIKINESNVDLDKGYLKSDTLTIHHDAVVGHKGKFHYEVTHKYDNGGKDVVKIWDEQPVKAKDAYDETKNIQRYVLYTDDELKQVQAKKEQAEKEQKQKSLIPTNEDLSEASLDLASNVADNESAIAELGEYIASLEERIAKLEG